MRNLVLSLLGLFSMLCAGCWPVKVINEAPTIRQLALIKALPVDMPGPLEPSGLTIWNGQLFTVADKDNGTIYRLELGDNAAKMIPFINFTPPQGYAMDWEGITVDSEGDFFLISEFYSRIAKVETDGSCQWVSPDLSIEASKSGLFGRSNAGFEGIAMLGPQHWLGAVEREPRGLVEFQISGDAQVTNSSILEQSPFSNVLTLLRIPDYSGLYRDGNALYALFRNAHLVVRLERSGDSFEETQAWSYKHIETDPDLAFIEQTYGQAEGLAVSGKDVYLIFDNNLGGRQKDPGDGRPLFVHARMPD